MSKEKDKMLEEESLTVAETIILEGKERLLYAFKWADEQEKEFQDLLDEARRAEIFKDVEE